MTYISRKEKVFELPEQETEISLPPPKRSDHRLKRFPSVNDRRAWTLEECEKYQHLYGLVSGSETSIAKSTGFKYIPFDVMFTVLMAEKDAYIQQLLEKQEQSYKENIVEDKDALIRKDAEVIALKNKIASLESQLEECRDTLRNSIQKLENFEDVINENVILRRKLKKEDGMGDGRSKIPISVHSGGDGETIRSNNKTDQDSFHKIEELENQLRQSESLAKKITTENETYKKKLEDMKCLEKYVEDMKVQAHNLTDKYKKASQKINEQTKQINNYASEIQALTEERNHLNKRVGALEKYESEYFTLQKKLQQVELIINENESLNVKVLHLNKLEAENEELRSTVEMLKSVETEADGGRERVLQLQKAISEQEAEIKNLFSQIENLSSLKTELEEKNNKIMLYERQLSEIPFMEAEIEKLRGKLEKYEDDLTSERDLLKNLKSELDICKKRCLEFEEMTLVLPISSKTNEEAERKENESESEIVILKAPEENESALLKASSCGIIELKEPTNLTCASSEISVSYSEDMKQIKQDEYDNLCREIDDLRKMIDKKYCRIEELEGERAELLGKLNKNGEDFIKLKGKIEDLNAENKKLTGELNESSNRINQMEKLLDVEQKARKFAEDLTKETEGKYLQELIERRKLEDLSKLQKEEFNLAKSGLEKNFEKRLEDLKREMEDLKVDVDVLKKLNEGLKTENLMLREEIDFVRKFEAKKAEDNFAARLRSELDNLWSLPKSEMEKECESLREKLKESEEELEDVKTALAYEKNLKNDLENNFKVEKEILENKEKIIRELLKSEEDLKGDNEKFREGINRLQRENKCLQDNIFNLSERIKADEGELTERLKKIEELKEKIKDFEKLLEESRELNEKICKEAEEMKNEKDSENSELKNEITKLNSEIEVLNNRLEENKLEMVPKLNYEEDLQEKYAIEEALRKIEAELDELKGKSSECQILLEELTILKENKKSLMIKVTDFEAKIEMLKNNPFEGKKIMEAFFLSCNKSVSCSSLSPVMSIEEHKKIIQEVENRHQSEIEKIKINHEGKIRILIDNYEKEEKIRGKTYNDAVSSLKSNYESDIRKLTERHKASINRLQELHEDEVQELNTNYETQMEAMQTQNENIVNDLTAKAKALAEEHNTEIKNLENKYQTLIREKEAELKSRLVDDFNQSELDGLKEKYENKMAELEEKHLNEIKKIKKNNLKKMDTFKLKYDDLLAEERKKCEEILLDRLRRGQQGDLNFERINNEGDSSEMFKIFKKLLTQGLEALTINERVLIHCKICLTAKGIGINSETKSASEPSIGDTCSNTSVIKADRELLLQRIYVLENEIANKEFQNQEIISNLEKAEKNRTQELKTALQSEVQKNAELKKKLSCQLKLQNDDKLEKYVSDRQENEFMEKMKELDKEKADKKNLEESLQNERNNVKRLTEILENEIVRFKTEKKRDGELIESMKLRLDEAISNEQIIESQLNYEASTRAKLQSDLESLQKSLNFIVESPPQFPSETKTAKDIKNLDQSKSIKSDKKIRSKSKSKTRRKT